MGVGVGVHRTLKFSIQWSLNKNIQIKGVWSIHLKNETMSKSYKQWWIIFNQWKEQIDHKSETNTNGTLIVLNWFAYPCFELALSINGGLHRTLKFSIQWSLNVMNLAISIIKKLHWTIWEKMGGEWCHHEVIREKFSNWELGEEKRNKQHFVTDAIVYYTQTYIILNK